MKRLIRSSLAALAGGILLTGVALSGSAMASSHSDANDNYHISPTVLNDLGSTANGKYIVRGLWLENESARQIRYAPNFEDYGTRANLVDHISNYCEDGADVTMHTGTHNSGRLYFASVACR